MLSPRETIGPISHKAAPAPRANELLLLLTRGPARPRCPSRVRCRNPALKAQGCVGYLSISKAGVKAAIDPKPQQSWLRMCREGTAAGPQEGGSSSSGPHSLHALGPALCRRSCTAARGHNATLCSLQGKPGRMSEAHSRSITEDSLPPHHINFPEIPSR